MGRKKARTKTRELEIRGGPLDGERFLMEPGEGGFSVSSEDIPALLHADDLGLAEEQVKPFYHRYVRFRRGNVELLEYDGTQWEVG